MKKMQLLLFSLVIFSCQKEPKNYAVISGKILNTKQITLQNEFNPEDKREISLMEDGSFRDTIKMNHSDKFLLLENKNSTTLYLTKESETIITYDSKNYHSTLKIHGTWKALNHYFAKRDLITKENKISNRQLYTKDENTFKATLSTIKSQQEQALKSLKKSPKTLKENELNHLRYEYLLAISKYKDYHPFYTKKDYIVSESLESELHELSFNEEEDYRYSTSYRKLLNSLFTSKAQNLADENSMDASLAMLQTLSIIENEFIRNELVFFYAKYGITFTNNLDAYYTKFLEVSNNKKNNNEIEKIYTSLKSISKGQVSPKFFNYENSEGSKTSLDDLKGKYVYIDVWATWCSPCIAEIPHLKKLKKKYQNSNIEFIGISIDYQKDYKKWKDMVVKKDLDGLELFADHSWNSDFVKKYLIKGLPRYILIDTEGIIVSANAPRPSDKKLTELFSSLGI